MEARLKQDARRRIAFRMWPLNSMAQQMAEEMWSSATTESFSEAAFDVIAELLADASKAAEELANLREVMKVWTHLVKRMRDELGGQKASEWIARVAAGEHDIESPWWARDRERHQDLRQVVKEYRNDDQDHTFCPPKGIYGACARCSICKQADALLEPQPAPVATQEEK